MKQNTLAFFLLLAILVETTVAANAHTITSESVKNPGLRFTRDAHAGSITEINLTAGVTLTRVVMNDPNRNETVRCKIKSTDTSLNCTKKNVQSLAQRDLDFHEAAHDLDRMVPCPSVFKCYSSFLHDGLYWMALNNLEAEAAQKYRSDFVDLLSFFNAAFGVDPNAQENTANPGEPRNSRSVLTESNKTMADVLIVFGRMVTSQVFPTTQNLKKMTQATATQAFQECVLQYERILTLKLPEVDRDWKEDMVLIATGAIQDLVESGKVVRPDDTLKKSNTSTYLAQNHSQPPLSIQTQLVQNYLAKLTGPTATAERLHMMAKYAFTMDNVPEMSYFLKEEIGHNTPETLQEEVKGILQTYGFILGSNDWNAHMAEFSISLRSALSNSADGQNPVREAVDGMTMADLTTLAKTINEVYRKAFDTSSMTVSGAGSP